MNEDNIWAEFEALIECMPKEQLKEFIRLGEELFQDSGKSFSRQDPSD